MDEAVIVIADLYLQPGELTPRLAAAPGLLPGLEYVGRFGERERLTAGWRGWLAHWLGRGDLAAVSVAGIAAAALPAGGDRETTRWIATPVELIAGLTRVHLERRGLVRLAPAEQAALADDFHRAFAGAGHGLQPLGDGQFLAMTRGVAALETVEPAHCAGTELAVPRGPAAAPRLRLVAEIEMWLHGTALNEARTARGDAPVTGLWLWGATGEALPAAAAGRRAAADRGARRGVAAFGSDAFVAGLMHLDGGALEALPAQAGTLFTDPRAGRSVIVTRLAADQEAAGQEAGALDGRLVRPALAALGAGSLGRLTLIANDVRITLGRYGGLKRWRRPRAGLAAFA
jgi:hypothetical protein